MPEFFYFELATPISKQSEFIHMDWRHRFLSSKGKKQIMEEIKILNKNVQKLISNSYLILFRNFFIIQDFRNDKNKIKITGNLYFKAIAT